MSDESYYTYDLDELDASIESLRSMLPPSTLYYSVKANPHPSIVQRCVDNGLSIEVSSVGELNVALDSGAHGSDIMCTGPGKSDAYLALATDAECCVSVESLDEIRRLNNQFDKTRVRTYVRINASRHGTKARLQMTGVPSQFGIDEDQAEYAIRAVVEGPHEFTGVHLYMGSNLESEDDLMEQFEIAIDVASQFSHHAQGTFSMDLGGGFGHPFARPGVRPTWMTLRERLTKLLEPCPDWKVAFESGRYIAGACGTLTMQIKEVKTSKGVRFSIASSGVNHLGGLAGLRRIPQVRAQEVAADEALGGDDMTTCLVGPLCTPVDVLSPQFLGTCRVGEEVTIPNVGAYGLSASLGNFLGHPYPLEIVTDSGVVQSVSRLTTVREQV